MHIVVCVFQLLCVLLLVHVFGVQCSIPPFLCLSSSSVAPLCDVVNAGLPTQDYLQPNIIYEPNEYPLFYATTTSTTTSTTLTVTYSAVGGAAYWSEASQSTALAVNTSAQLNSTLICSNTGTSNITITLTTPTFSPVTIYFYKSCQFPLFEVGSFSNDNIIITDSQVNSAYANWEQYADSQSFYFYLSNSQPVILSQPFTLNVFGWDPNVLAINLSATSGTAQLQSSLPQTSIVLNYTCLLIGKSDTVISAVLSWGWNSTLAFSWHKICGSFLPMPGLNIGSVSGQWNIANDGVVLPPWDAPVRYKFDEIQQLNLYILSSNLTVPVPFSVELLPVNPAIYTVNPLDPIAGTLVFNQLTTIRLQILCIANGQAQTIIQIDVNNYHRVQLEIIYPCKQPLFDMGLFLGDSEIISQGVQTNWSGGASADDVFTQFFLYLDQNDYFDSAPYKLTACCYDPTLIQPQINDTNNGVAHRYGPGTNATIPFDVIYNCQGKTVFQTPISIIIDYGWQTTYSVTFVKDCIAPASTPSGSGWPAAAIAIFVLFWISFVACLGGCIYNRYKLDKHGWSIVPGAVSLRECVDHIRTRGRSQRWTAQDDYEQPFSTRGQSNYYSSSNL